MSSTKKNKAHVLEAEGYKLALVDPRDIIPYGQNNKIHTDESIERLADSMLAVGGFNRPVSLAMDGKTAMAGHKSVEAAKLNIDRGHDEYQLIPVQICTTDETQQRAFTLAENRHNELSPFDFEVVASELQLLQDADFDIEMTGFDDSFIIDPDLDQDDEEGAYTGKIEAPIYEPKLDAPPPIESLYSTTKTNKLITEIENAELHNPELIHFLRAAASRHTVFQYDKIAEYYAHGSNEVKRLMELSGLVIIDFDAAIENGFVHTSKELDKIYKRDETTTDEPEHA